MTSMRSSSASMLSSVAKPLALWLPNNLPKARAVSMPLSRTLCMSTRPSALRSPGSSPMPARMASRGEPNRAGLPSSCICPVVKGICPKMAMDKATRPAPWIPARPTISPARRVSEISFSTPLPAPSMARMGAPISSGRAGGA
ncbi:hypothetical protein D9M68_857650 [compost metagenome]